MSGYINKLDEFYVNWNNYLNDRKKYLKTIEKNIYDISNKQDRPVTLQPKEHIPLYRSLMQEKFKVIAEIDTTNKILGDLKERQEQ